jgi:hypothetical protein
MSPEIEVAVLGDYNHFLHGMLRKALDRVGIRYAPTATDDTAVVVFWNPWSRLRWEEIAPPNVQARTVNATGFHCAKSNVTRHFETAFGYRLRVDPVEYEGPIVAKSELNATHDGRILAGPIPVKDLNEGDTYQRLVHNDFGPSVVDIRVSVVGTVMAGCWVKVRPDTAEERFSNSNSIVWLAPTRFLLARSEVEKIDAFCSSIGLEFGQLDVCRDRVSGLIYIVDANNTPYGPANGMSPWDADASLLALGVDFARQFGLTLPQGITKRDPLLLLQGTDRAAATVALKALQSLRGVPPAYALTRWAVRFARRVRTALPRGAERS